MKFKSTIFCLIILLTISLSLGIVCAGENASSTHPETLSVEESPIDVESETVEIDNDVSTPVDQTESNDNILSSSIDSEEENNALSINEESEILSEQHIEEVHVDVEGDLNIVVNKNWQDDYSGNITHVEIQLLRKLIHVEEAHVQATEDFSDNTEPIFNETIGTLVVLPDKYGVLTSYEIIRIVNVTKDDNWQYTFTRLSDYIQDYDDFYVVREVNLPNNVEFVSHVSYYDLTQNTIFINLTNKVIPNETTNETNQTNTTIENNTTINETSENNSTNETFDDEEEFTDWDEDEDDFEEDYTDDRDDSAMGPVEKNETGSSQSTKVEEPETTSEGSQNQTQSGNNVSVDKNATGNPLLILLVLISMIPVLRKRD